MSRSSDALALARGDVRDGVASIEHFLQVLGSRRVGPRVLARGVPEVLGGCAPLRSALAALTGALRAELAADREGVEATEALLAHAGARVDELAAALEVHVGATTMDARERLALEAVVRGVAGELGAVVRLVDLFGAPVTSETTTIDLRDALAQRRARPSTGAQRLGRLDPSTPPVLAAVDVRVSELTVGDARLVLELLELAVAIVVRAGVAAPRVVVELGPEGFPVFTVGAGPALSADGGDGEVLDAIVRAELPREVDVVSSAARHAGVSLKIEADRRTVTLAL